MQAYGLCPKCMKMKPMTMHHIYPRRHFKPRNAPKFPLCRDCHDALELLIPFRKLPKEQYETILKNFLRRKNEDNIRLSAVRSNPRLPNQGETVTL